MEQVNEGEKLKPPNYLVAWGFYPGVEERRRANSLIGGATIWGLSSQESDTTTPTCLGFPALLGVAPTDCLSACRVVQRLAGGKVSDAKATICYEGSLLHLPPSNSLESHLRHNQEVSSPLSADLLAPSRSKCQPRTPRATKTSHTTVQDCPKTTSVFSTPARLPGLMRPSSVTSHATPPTLKSLQGAAARLGDTRADCLFAS